MKKVNFYGLDAENKDTAILQMLSFKNSHGWPNGADWKNEEDVSKDLEQGWNADEYFSFYTDENEEVVTKIG